MTVAPTPPMRPPDAREARPQFGAAHPTAEVRLQALERFVKDYMLAAQPSKRFAELARNVTDLLSEDMTEAEKDGAWALIRYAKRREHAAQQKEQPDG